MVDKKKPVSTRDAKGAASAKGKAGSPDRLVGAGKKGDVELGEDELKGVAGGAQVDFFLKIDKT